MEFLTFAAFFILLLSGTLGIIAALRFITFAKSGEAHIRFAETHLATKSDDRAFARWYNRKCAHYTRALAGCTGTWLASFAYLMYKAWISYA